jgi:hypothetical protein
MSKVSKILFRYGNPRSIYFDVFRNSDVKLIEASYYEGQKTKMGA